MYALVRFVVDKQGDTIHRQVVSTNEDWKPLRDHISSIATGSARWGMHPYDEVCWSHYGTQYFIEELKESEPCQP